jgi:hypothetical protein
MQGHANFKVSFFLVIDLPSVAGFMGLTAETPRQYIPVRRGRSRRGGLSKSPNGPVEGLSPEIVERTVLTFTKRARRRVIYTRSGGRFPDHA